VGKPEGKRPLGRQGCSWEDNIKVDLEKTKGGGMKWIDPSQDRDQWKALVNMAVNLWAA
jgi:hypothetical protein